MIIKVPFIDTPISPHEVKTSKTQHDRMLKTCKEHTHEANTREIRNRTNTPFILSEWNAELIPCDILRSSIAQLHTRITLIYNKITPHNHIIRTN